MLMDKIPLPSGQVFISAQRSINVLTHVEYKPMCTTHFTSNTTGLVGLKIGAWDKKLHVRTYLICLKCQYLLMGIMLPTFLSLATCNSAICAFFSTLQKGNNYGYALYPLQLSISAVSRCKCITTKFATKLQRTPGLTNRFLFASKSLTAMLKSRLQQASTHKQFFYIFFTR